MGLRSEDDMTPSKLAIMDEDTSDKPSKLYLFYNEKLERTAFRKSFILRV